MPAYHIAYDLNRPGQNYPDLIRALRAAGAVSILKSSWVLAASENAAQVRDHFKAFVDANDKIFVSEVNSNWASWNMLNPEAAKRILPP